MRAQTILRRHLASLGSADITPALGKGLTELTLGLYASLLEALPPTPSRFHYIFNLRDLSRVYEGLLACSGDSVAGPADLLRLWRNEVTPLRARMGCMHACVQRLLHALLG